MVDLVDRTDSVVVNHSHHVRVNSFYDKVKHVNIPDVEREDSDLSDDDTIMLVESQESDTDDISDERVDDAPKIKSDQEDDLPLIERLHLNEKKKKDGNTSKRFQIFKHLYNFLCFYFPKISSTK